MKKATLLFVFMIGCTSFLSAQKKFEIAISGVSVTGKGSIDTVHIDDAVVLNITFQNDGAFPVINGSYQPDSFPGGLCSFNNSISLDGSSKKIDFVKQLLLPTMGYKGFATIQDTIVISAKYYVSDSTNIFIVWPGGGKIVATQDSLDTTQINNYHFYVLPAEAGINSHIQSTGSFKIYPNPAKDVVNIEMHQPGTGTIRLMDMTGKLIAEKTYTAQKGENVTLPLNAGNSIPDGLYLIGIQNASGYQVSKVVVCR